MDMCFFGRFGFFVVWILTNHHGTQNDGLDSTGRFSTRSGSDQRSSLYNTLARSGIRSPSVETTFSRASSDALTTVGRLAGASTLNTALCDGVRPVCRHPDDRGGLYEAEAEAAGAGPAL